MCEGIRQQGGRRRCGREGKEMQEKGGKVITWEWRKGREERGRGIKIRKKLFPAEFQRHCYTSFYTYSSSTIQVVKQYCSH